MSIVVRQISLSEIDLQASVDLISRSFFERLNAGIVTLGSRMTVPMFKERFCRDALFVAEDSTSPHGYSGILIVSGEKDGYLELLAIAPENKRSGVGSLLLQHAEGFVLSRGGRFLRSDTGLSMSSSIKWHLKNGFYKVAFTSYPSTDYYSIVFRKDLAPIFLPRLRAMIHLLSSFIKTVVTKGPHLRVKEENKLELKDIQQVSVDILSEVHEFCVTHGIKYTLGYGSLIGAVRHQGFIPWDDDIDIIMPRPDYERFLSTFRVPGLAVFPGHHPDSYIQYSHVCDLSRTFARTRFPYAKNCFGGVWIDVFPADAVEDDFSVFSAKVSRLKELFSQQIYLRDPKASFSSMPTLKKKIGLALRKIQRKAGKGLDEVNREMDRIIRSVPWGSTSHWSQMACMDEGVKMYQLTEDFQHTILMPFEGKEFMVLAEYDRELRKIYGDYMQLPPVEERVPHQTFVSFYWFDPPRS